MTVMCLINTTWQLYTGLVHRKHINSICILQALPRGRNDTIDYSTKRLDLTVYALTHT